jgi:tryptophanyl-tRNA synthetase
MRILSGLQPSGRLHIGNFFGMMEPALKLQHEGDAYYFIADYHSLTSIHDGKALRGFVRELAVDFLACGLDPDKCVFFRQSDVPEHTELSWIFTTITPLGDLERQTQFKDKSSKVESIPAGLLMYPVLQSADILLYRADSVPVGEDQIQHLELARDTSRKFNLKFGVEYFPEPKPLLTPTRRIMGLDGNAKMSKSLGNTIGLLETDDEIWQKLRPAMTDPQRVRKSDPGRPEVCNLYQLHQAFNDDATVAHVAEQCRTAGWGCMDCKKVLLEGVVQELTPIRRRSAELDAEPQLVLDAIADGGRAARGIAQQTIREVREIMGLGAVTAAALG